MSTWDIHKTGPFLVLICGSRYYQNREAIAEFLEKIYDLNPNLLVLEGGASGADRIAKEEAKKRGIGVVHVEANWRFYDKAAGPLRNCWMASLKPNLIVGFHENIEESKGTAHMLDLADELDIPNVLIEE